MKKNLGIKNLSLKIKASLTLFLLLLTFFVGTTRPVQAIGTPVIDTTQILQTKLQYIQTTIKEKQASWFKTWGSKLVGTTIRNTLNRIALSAATYVATAGEGQKPTYVVEDFGTYWKNIGDAAAGDFIDGLGKQWQVDLCQPLDANIQAKIGLGLVQTMAPATPDCTLSNLVSSYSTAYEKYAAMSSGDYLKGIQVSFDPGGSELSSAFTLFGRTEEVSTKAADTEKTSNTITQGWLDVRNIAGKLKGTPGAAKEDLSNAKAAQTQNLLSTTGDALVDAANTFLNQLAYEGFQRVLREISKGKSSSSSYDFSKFNSGSAFESLIQYGESVISEKLATIVKPHFDVRSDYSILSELSTCSDSNNPGPNNCVIDDKFSQAISEKLTVGEALDKGYLHGDWLVTTDNKADSSYTLRNASILRKYRIVPIGWEQAITLAAAKSYKVTFQDLVSCFDGSGNFSSDFNKSDTAWCKGLVDPNWVLKAPLNSCNKEGIGGQISSTLVTKDDNGNSVLAISRASDYCADDQTCIKEKNDGSCEVYGYCNEEKRTWNFSSDSCEPVFNTCKTFTNTSNNQVASMLENTVDYSTCNANNSGCKQYYSNGSYASSTGQITWDKASSIFLNNQAVSCDSTNEGCTKLLRGKPGWTDVNFIMDSDFNNTDLASNSTAAGWHWPTKNGVSSINTDNGDKALGIAGSSGAALYSNSSNSLIPKGLTAISGWSYTLSADIKINSGDKVVMSLGDNGNSNEIATASDWTTVSVTVSSGSSINNLDFSITGYGSSVNFLIKNLKLSPNNFYSAYTSYAAFPIYEKLIPAYLESTCYISATGSGDYRLKDNAPAICSNYARKCNRQEVGCELFTAVKDNFAVAAKANVSDYCDAKCVGYNTYIAKASYFYDTSADNLIPDNATACSAQSVGCAGFTNLDTVAAGGEGLEYYSKIQQCIKPDTTSCSDFYSWDNSQLKVMPLKKDSSGNPFVIDTASDATCNKEIYNLPITDPRYNSDCREFYNKSGQITYHLLTNTVSCSNNCHAYRLNETDIDKSLNSASCTGSGKSWDSTQGACRVCKNGGTWNSTQNACVYQAIPNEGTTCTAQEVGCREYNGNSGSNVRLSASYDFETGTDGFTGNVVQNNESTVKDGHSLTINGSGAVGAQSFVEKDSAYVIKFIAKAASNTNVKFSFINSAGEAAIFNTSDNNTSGNLVIKGGNEWNLYEINLSDLNHDVADEKLNITSAGGVYLDNLTVNEISDRYYLIKGSSDVPDVCSYDMSDNYQGPDYNLGCQQYKDRAGTINNLHQFSELCQNSAVGCEQLIQTHDSSDFYGHNVNLNGVTKTATCAPGTAGCLEVKGHQVLYAVFDSTKQCNQTDAGCARFGYSKVSGATTSWADAYKKNLPDTYNSETASPLCQSGEVGCETWTYGSDNSSSYFKDPGLNTCIYKSGAWYKSPVKRCDLNSDGRISGTEESGNICVADSDCGSRKCVTDNNNYPCTVSYLKTMGLGGSAGKIATPNGLVGMCNTESSGCSEYIDPSSKFVNNLIYNPAAEDIDRDGIGGDKWISSSAGYYQRIGLKPNKLYVLQVDGALPSAAVLNSFGATAVTSGGQVRILGADNNLGELVSTVSTSKSIIFNSGSNNYVTVYRPNITTDKTAPAASVSLKEAIINYQLDSNIDTSSCNGVVNTDNGCILFNARTQAGRSGLRRLLYNAYNTSEGAAPVTCSGADCSANQIIKVSPNRVCSRWLSCQTYVEDPTTHEKTCYGMGECDQLNDKNECGNFLSLSNTVRDMTNSQNKNATGYSLLNNYYLGAMKEVGQNTDAHFDFESNMVSLSCRRDVDVASNPALNAEKNKTCLFDKNINESLVLTPDTKGTDYPAHGKGYLKVLNYYQISPLSANASIAVYTNQDYYVNYLVNTNGSSAKAKLIITDDNSTNPRVKVSFVDEAPNGWVRKVQHFRINDSTKHQIHIKIYLTSATTKVEAGYVYFDDINIEPVLKTTNNSYVAKDCRLYPSDDSLTCSSVNNNVVKDGLYGYCLQYDPLNKGVCQLWYPVDKIAPITRNTESVLGYSGKIPLYYCSEVNGKFSFVEKRIGVPHGFQGGQPNTFGAIINRELKDGSPYDVIINEGNISKDSDGKADVIRYNSASCSDYGVTVKGDQPNGDHRCFCFNSTASSRLCGDSPDYAALGWMAGDSDKWFGYYCVPKKDNLLVTSEKKTVNFNEVFGNDSPCEFSFYEGWGTYKGFIYDVSRYGSVHGPHMDNPGALQKIDESNNGKEAGYDSLMILNNNESTINDLKYLSNQDSDSTYRLTCNRFVQLVDNEGNNMAWTGRTGRNSNFPTSTPTFFPSGYGLSLYGRNREDVPFGSSIIAGGYDLTNTDRIMFRNQYSTKNNETLLAGRPYGCSTTGGVSDSGCSNIGQCSLDPNVLCFYIAGEPEINKKSCSGGGNGECIKLWTTAPTFSGADSILNTLFNKKYGDYAYSSGGYRLTTGNNFTVPSSAIFPSISNTKLKSGTTELSISAGKVNITNGDLYELEFNTSVASEQQPLKQIIIDWGDGNTQIITNTDNKPEAGLPHQFYHYYTIGAKHIEIKVIDNWETYKCRAMSGTGWTDNSCSVLN